MMLTKGPMPLPYLSDVNGRDANMLKESAVLVGKVVTFKFPVFFYLVLIHVVCILV